MKKLKQFVKMYIWALKESYSFMQGLRTVGFWLKLPFKAFKIAYLTIWEPKNYGN